MNMNATLENNIFSFDCPECGTRNSTDISDYDPQYLEEIGTYENLTVFCSNCPVQIGFNMALPLFEIAEPPGYFEYASEDDRKLRAILREIMWKRMPELREKDYESELEEYKKEHGLNEEIDGTPQLPAVVPEQPADDPAEETQPPVEEDPTEETPEAPAQDGGEENE